MRPRTTRRLLAGVGALALAGGVLALRPPRARGTAPDTAAFLADARAGTARYRERQHAIDDGFTRVGTEFPAMGEHWVSFSRVMDDTLDARRPSVLIYVNAADGPRLAGVAYSRLLARGQRPPTLPFDGAWHEHSGAVADESLPLGHGAHGVHAAAATPVTMAGDDSPRFFILHAWVWADNPDGAFATDNWTLPLARLGVPTASRADHDVARGLALAADSGDYHRAMIAQSLALRPDEDSVVAAVIGRVRDTAALDAGVVRASRALDAGSSRRLASTWGAMWSELARALPARAHELESLRSRM